jgi:YidC/Oxa1 family membrane protein insertase
LESVLATNILLDPIVAFLSTVLGTLTQYTHNFGLSLIVLAVLVKLVFWPLSAMQFKSIAKMQALQPQLKALQARLKGEPQKLQQEQMALYREQKVNPFASCLPLLLQMPILWSIYYAIWHSCSEFAQSSFLWIGSSISNMTPVIGHMNDTCSKGHEQLSMHILATSLLLPDYFLLALYVVSMYFSVRFSSPALDESQAQQQRIMAFVSPVMIAFIGRQWPSALILYWLTFNVLSTAQQMYMMGRFAAKPAPATIPVATNGALSDKRTTPAADRKAAAQGGGRQSRRKRGSRR